jgi:predicted MPP superfamily phosphohydrolase
MRALFAALLLAISARPQDEPDFSFVHCSDPHAPIAGSAETIAEIKKFGALELPAGGATKAPSFVVVTGDLTEFGAKEGWESYRGWWKDSTVPVYSVMGNHDGTWDCLRPKLRAVHGAPWYSWDLRCR